MMGKTLMAAVLAAGLAFGTPATAGKYSNLYVFGDSLVDSGNAQYGRREKGGEDPAPKAQGFFDGRFSNGYNFADDLSFAISGAPATASSYNGTNFSVGGAQAAEVAGDESPSFAEQIGVYDLSGKKFDAQSLVLVTLGGNDVRAELGKLGTIPGYTPSLAPALGAFTTGLTSLIDRGARNIVVTGLPNIGQIPAVTLLGSPALAGAGTALSAQLNQAFAQTVATMAFQTGVNLQFFDLFAYQQTIYADPAKFGVTTPLNTRDACLRTAGAAPACDGFVYFDTIHPTAPLHAAIAQGLIAQVGAVPEPSSWIMMIVGFGLAGAGLRRRRRQPVAALAA